MIKRTLKNLARKLGYEIIATRDHKTVQAARQGVTLFNEGVFDWLHDADFNRRYAAAVVATGFEESPYHRARAYVLAQTLKVALKRFEAAPTELFEMVECGVERGASSHLLCGIAQSVLGNERVRHHVFDSFEGISPRERVDVVNETVPEYSLTPDHLGQTCLAYDEDLVRRNLAPYPFIDYRKGWIPTAFPQVADRKFHLVHVDVDVYQPIRDSFEFFLPRLHAGGIMVCDDYGFLDWPGARKAVDEFVVAHGLEAIRLPTAQALIMP
jgi:hypothetical protein